jgi:hypothetical protein
MNEDITWNIVNRNSNTYYVITESYNVSESYILQIYDDSEKLDIVTEWMISIEEDRKGYFSVEEEIGVTKCEISGLLSNCYKVTFTYETDKLF